MHPDNTTLVSGGQDSLIVFWDLSELMCSESFSNNDYQIRKLAFNRTGEYLAAICYDELQKKW